MDPVVNPGRREITVDPASPNLPHARVKSSNTTFRPGAAVFREPVRPGGRADPALDPPAPPQ